jgi:hypothetical protein
MRTMVRWIVSSAVAVLAGAFAALPAAGQRAPSDGFNVTFEGIILHADLSMLEGYPPFSRRAILVDPGMITSMRHVAELILPKDVVRATVRDATGGLPECDDLRCRIRIQGFVMQIIRRKDIPPKKGPAPAAAPPPAALKIDDTFQNFVPHLYEDPDIDAGGLAADVVTDQLPNAPAAGYFELSNRGKLIACPFLYDGIVKNGGSFVSEDEKGKPRIGGTRAFARLVRWIDPDIEEPVLQIRSLHSSNRWVTIEFTTQHPLTLLVHNRPRGKTHRTSDHFVLFEKLLPDTTLPAIVRDFYRVDDTCGTRATVYVPGCADSGWP